MKQLIFYTILIQVFLAHGIWPGRASPSMLRWPFPRCSAIGAVFAAIDSLFSKPRLSRSPSSSLIVINVGRKSVR
jgi:hypothetical protein